MRRAQRLTGPLPLRRTQAGFAALAEIVVGQMLSTASAEAIWTRVERLARPFTAATVLNLADAELLGAGLSVGKLKTLRALATAVSTGGLDLPTLGGLTDEAVHATLVALPGIGPWTADLYILFCLGRADGFAPGDLALQVAAAELMGLDERPGPRELAAIAERWRPWRGVAARQLWAYYRLIKGRRGAPAL